MKIKQTLTQENSLTLMHYKEPLKSIPKSLGYGYYGAIQVTLDGTQLQCHICGDLYTNLSMHIRMMHKMPLKEYRETYQIARRTALISENFRKKKKDRMFGWWWKLSQAERDRRISKRVKALRKWHKTASARGYKWNVQLETRNKRGTCPDQLIDKIKKMAAKLGRTPHLSDLQKEGGGGRRFAYLYKNTFGSFAEAVKRAGLEPAKKFIYREGKKNKYSDEELLDFISIFWQENQRVPTETDYLRGFVPSPQVYKRRFGSLQKARELAGVWGNMASEWNNDIMGTAVREASVSDGS